jgi:DNA mismatch repair ATPase MutS
MPASIRIIKIMKDKNPMTGEDEEAYTVEIECEADNAKDLAKELATCPYGEEIMDLLERAKFIPKSKIGSIAELKAEAEKEEADRKKMEERLREEGREEIREKYIVHLRNKNKLRAAEILDELVEEEKAKLEEKDTEETQQSYHERDERGM